MKKTIFKGMATAIVTPMTKTDIDYEALGRFIEFQIENGINAIVVMGTTGENATIEYCDQKEVIRFTVNKVAGRVPVIAGTGTNNTDHVLHNTRNACEVGADAVLVVTPYYNKATQGGLIKMYTELADAASKPVVLYNVPSRTGVNIEPTTYAALAEHPNIVAFKEANGNLSKIVETMALVGDKLAMYSGNDDQIVPLMSIGGIGAISVLSNILPAETVAICDKFFAGDIKGSAALQCRYHALINALFSEVNPIPVKAAMAAMGYGENSLRLPLTEMESAHERVLLDLMRKEGLSV